MGKFFSGVLIGIVLTFVGLFILVLALGRMFASKPPSVPSNSALLLNLNGDIPEAAPIDISVPFFQQRTAPTIRDLWSSLHQAATDPRVKAVVLEPRGVMAGWGRLEEIRQDLVEFRRSGKPVYAYLERPHSREYYIATAADKIYLSPGDMLDVKGFRLEATYLKDGLDKLGVQFEVDHVGRYKDAGDIFTKSEMSPETREVLGQVLDQIYGEFCAATGQGRHKSEDDMKALVDIGPFVAEQAKASGLVDAVGYEDELYGDLRKRTTAGLQKLDIRSYFRANPGKGDHVAVLVGEGEITEGEPSGTVSSGDIASQSFAKLVRKLREDTTIRGVVLRVNSPGGDALASDEILHELKLLSAVKPLVISMSDLAASGGYYISMTGDPVVAYPNTITGSIGVLYARPVVKGLFDKLGIQTSSINRGKLADMDSVTQPLSDAARQKLHESIEATYKLFVGKVAAARRRGYDQIDSIAQGRVWMGSQARQNGLIDELGGLDRAVAIVRQKAHLPPNGETNLIAFPPRRSLLDVISDTTPDALEDTMADSKIRSWLPGLPGRALLKGGLLKILPYQVTVQ